MTDVIRCTRTKSVCFIYSVHQVMNNEQDMTANLLLQKSKNHLITITSKDQAYCIFKGPELKNGGRSSNDLFVMLKFDGIYISFILDENLSKL